MAWLKTRFKSMPIFYSWKSRCSLLYNCDLIAVAFLIFISSLLYLYYFKESTGNHLKAMNDEFHLFLADLLPNVGISILFPVCIFARNPDLQRLKHPVNQRFSYLNTIYSWSIKDNKWIHIEIDFKHSISIYKLIAFISFLLWILPIS